MVVEVVYTSSVSGMTTNDDLPYKAIAVRSSAWVLAHPTLSRLGSTCIVAGESYMFGRE